MEYTCVFYEPTFKDAKKRLAYLRKVDRYYEIKAYILQEGNEFRVLRKVDTSKKKQSAK